MYDFLKLLLAVIVGLIVLGVVAFFAIKLWIKNWWAGVMEQVQQEMMGGAPPFRIRLFRDEHDELAESDNAEKIDEFTKEFQSLGFTRIGDFQAPECFVNLRAFQHHEHHIYGIIYDHATVPVWCDLYRRYEDETGWTYANKEDDLSDRPPWSNTHFCPDKSLAEIFERLLSETPKEGLLKAGADKFVKNLEAAYAREMNWRISRGGPSEAEIRRIGEKDGIEVGPEHIEACQRPWREAISEFLSERMVENWRAKSGHSTAEFDEKAHRLLGVHKRMTPMKILAAVDDEYWEGAEEIDPDEDESDLDPELKRWRKDFELLKHGCDEGSPINVFHAYLKKRNKEREFQLLGTVDRPIKGEIWLKPDEYEHEGIDMADFDDIDTDD